MRGVVGGIRIRGREKKRGKGMENEICLSLPVWRVCLIVKFLVANHLSVYIHTANASIYLCS